MVLQHTVLPAMMSTAEPTVPHDRLRPFLAVFERALQLLRRHAAAHGRCERQRSVWRERRERYGVREVVR